MKHLLKLSACLLLAAPKAGILAATIISLPNNLSVAPGQGSGPPPIDPVNLAVSLSSGAGVTDVTFGLNIDFTRLVITGVAVNPALSGATFTVTTSGSGTTGTATFAFHDAVPLSSGPVELGELVCSVPDTAPLGPTTLHFNGSPFATLNGGAITVSTVDGMVTVVPEPSISAFLILGSAAFLLWPRRNRVIS